MPLFKDTLKFNRKALLGMSDLRNGTHRTGIRVHHESVEDNLTHVVVIPDGSCVWLVPIDYKLDGPNIVVKVEEVNPQVEVSVAVLAGRFGIRPDGVVFPKPKPEPEPEPKAKAAPKKTSKPRAKKEKSDG